MVLQEVLEAFGIGGASANLVEIVVAALAIYAIVGAAKEYNEKKK